MLKCTFYRKIRKVCRKASKAINTLRLTHVVVVVSGFLVNAFFYIPSSSRKEVENEEKTIDGLQKKLK